MNVGKYKVIRALGQGGMAKILLAANLAGEQVVLKIPLKKDPEQLERLRDEARIGQKLKHPSVVETLDLLDEGHRPILVVEYVRGASLSQLRRLGPLPPSVVVRVGRQIAEGLAALHEANDEEGRSLDILHRDVTGGNILLDEHGNAKLIDLGIARSEVSQARKTRLGVVRGTLRYLAPELLMGSGHTQATDLWSLGVTLWEALLGRRALDGEQQQVMRDIRDMNVMTYHDGEAVDPRIHDAIAAILAPQESRLQKARAVANVFARLENAFGDGQVESVKAVKTVLDALAPTEERPLSETTRELLVAAWGVDDKESQGPSPIVKGDFDFDDEETVRRAPLGELPTAALRSDQAPTREGQVPMPSDALPSTTTRSPVPGSPRPIAAPAALLEGGEVATIQMAAYEYPEEVQKALANPSLNASPKSAGSVAAGSLDHGANSASAVEEVGRATKKDTPAPVSALDEAAVESFVADAQKTTADVPSALRTEADSPSAMHTQALHGDAIKRAIGGQEATPKAASPLVKTIAPPSENQTPNKGGPPSSLAENGSSAGVQKVSPQNAPSEQKSVDEKALAELEDSAAGKAESLAAESLAGQEEVKEPTSKGDESKKPGFVEMPTEVVDHRSDADLDDDVDWKPNRTGLYVAAGFVILVFGALAVYAVVDVFLMRGAQSESAPAAPEQTQPVASDAGALQKDAGVAPLAKPAVVAPKTTKKKKRKRGKRRRKRRPRNK